MTYRRSSGGPVLWPRTACVAAENLGRRWIGIDISPKAVELVNMRLHQSMGDLFHNRLVTTRGDIPKRTDIDAPAPYPPNKYILSGPQEGRCYSRRSKYPLHVLEWITSSRSVSVGRTTSRNSSYCALTATG